MIDCREAVSRMWAYLEQGLEADRTHELDAHLDTCVRCCGELEFSRHLRNRVAVADAVPLPEPLKVRVDALLETTEQEGRG